MSKKYLKMFIILINLGNINQNNSEVSSYPSQNGKIYQGKKQMLARPQGEGNSLYSWWDLKLVQKCWKSRWKSLKIFEISHMTHLCYSLAYTKRFQHLSLQIICSAVLNAILFTIPRKWKQPRCLSSDK